MDYVSKDAQARIEAFGDSVRDLLAAGDDPGEQTAAYNAMRQASSNYDPAEMLNKIHMPADAGDMASGLDAIMHRIPDGWGRWISCGKGWYPILIALDNQLRQISPDYTVHQVKEKYGTLRFYYSLGTAYTDLPIPDDDPRPEGWSGPDDPDYTEKKRARNAWNRRQKERWSVSDEGKAWNAKHEAAHALVEAAEALAAKTCEHCGAEGEMSYTLGQSPWHQTLCAACRNEKEFVTVDEWQVWWDANKERIRLDNWQRDRDYCASRYANKRILVASQNPEHQVRDDLDSSYVRTLAEVDELWTRAEDWDEIWLEHDEVGEAIAERINRQYAQLIEENEALVKAGANTNNLPKPDGAPAAAILSWSKDSNMTHLFHRIRLPISVLTHSDAWKPESMHKKPGAQPH